MISSAQGALVGEGRVLATPVQASQVAGFSLPGTAFVPLVCSVTSWEQDIENMASV